MTPGRRDQVILAGILLTAAALRFANLPSRGEWDDDQGKQLLDVMLWVRDGQVPLLGPVTSIGTAHHGAAFYVLLAPGALLTDNNPVAAVAVLALLGTAGVAATWWLGRTVGGAAAGHIAGLLVAVSPSAIQASTFVWNSNIVGPGAALAVAAGWHAWRTRQAKWWMASAVGALLMLNGHLLAFVVGLPLAALLVADILRRSPPERRRMTWPVVGAATIVAAGLVPLLIHELLHDFTETRAILDYAFGSGPSGMVAPAGLPIAAMPVIAWRVLVWPMSGLATAAPLFGLPAVIVTLSALVVSASGEPGIARQFGRWAIATTAWTVIALTLISPSLAVIAPGLPNDQYHAWLDPILFAAIGVAVARVGEAAGLPNRLAALSIVLACVGLSLMSLPSLTAPDGGWPRAEAAAARIHSATGDRTIAVTGVAKTGAAIEFPLRRGHAPIVDVSAAEALVVSCDPLFDRAVGMPCGGTAEDQKALQSGFPISHLIDRFTDGPRRTVSIYSR